MAKPVVFRVTNNLKLGGVQKRLASVLPLLARDFRVHVVTYRDQGPLVRVLEDAGVRCHFTPFHGKWSPLGISGLARLFREHGADLVHTHSLGGNIAGILAAARAGVAVRVAQVHHRGAHWYAATALGRRKQALQESLVHRLFTHRVLHVSQESLEYFQRMTGLPGRMLSVLHNGVAFPERSGAADAGGPQAELGTELRAELGLGPDTLVLGFVGRFVRGKGVSFLLDFAEALLAAQDNVAVVAVGDGNRLERARRRVAEAGLEGRLLLPGRREDVDRFYALFDAFLFPSQGAWEGMPGVVLEAAGAGLPILARETRPVREVAGYYSRIHFMVEDSDPSRSLEAALALPEDDGAALRAEFSIQAMADRTRALYEELLEEKQS